MIKYLKLCTRKKDFKSLGNKIVKKNCKNIAHCCLLFHDKYKPQNPWKAQQISITESFS